MKPIPRTALLSAQEAKERLREIVEGFFFWRLRTEMENSCGQTSWSKALVRHGADPRMAIAAVLGVAAEDVQVREPPELAQVPSALTSQHSPLRPQTANERN